MKSKAATKPTKQSRARITNEDIQNLFHKQGIVIRFLDEARKEHGKQILEQESTIQSLEKGLDEARRILSALTTSNDQRVFSEKQMQGQQRSQTGSLSLTIDPIAGTFSIHGENVSVKEFRKAIQAMQRMSNENEY